MVHPIPPHSSDRGRSVKREARARTRRGRSRTPLRAESPTWVDSDPQKAVEQAVSTSPRDCEPSLLQPDVVLHSESAKVDPPSCLEEDVLDYEAPSTSVDHSVIDVDDGASVCEVDHLDIHSVYGVSSSDDEISCSAPRLPRNFPTYGPGPSSAKPPVYTFEPNLGQIGARLGQKLSASLDLQTPSPQGGSSAPCPSPSLPCNEPDLHRILNNFVDQNFGAGPSNQRPVLLGDPPAQGPALQAPALQAPSLPPPPPPGPPRARAPRSPRGVRRELPEREFALQRRPRKRSKRNRERREIKKQVLKYHTRYLEARDYRSHGDPPGTCAPLVPCTEGPSNHIVSSVLIKQFVQNQWCECPSEGFRSANQCTCDSALQDIVLRMQINTTSVGSNLNIMDTQWP